MASANATEMSNHKGRVSLDFPETSDSTKRRSDQRVKKRGRENTHRHAQPGLGPEIFLNVVQTCKLTLGKINNLATVVLFGWSRDP